MRTMAVPVTALLVAALSVTGVAAAGLRSSASAAAARQKARVGLQASAAQLAKALTTALRSLHPSLSDRELAKMAREELWREADALDDERELGWAPLVEYARDAPSYMLILPLDATGSGQDMAEAASPEDNGSNFAEVQAAPPTASKKIARGAASESESEVMTYDGNGNVKVQKKTCKNGKCSESTKVQKASSADGDTGLASVLSSRSHRDEGSGSDLSQDADAVGRDIQRAHDELAENLRRMNDEMAGISATFGHDGFGDIMDGVFDSARRRPGSWFAGGGDAAKQLADAESQMGSVMGSERIETYVKDGQLVKKTKKCDGKDHCVEEVVTRALPGQATHAGRAQAPPQAVPQAKAAPQKEQPHHGATWPF